MVSQVYLFQWFIMFIYKIIWNCPLIMGTWSCCIDFGFRIQTRGFFWLAKKIQNFRFCSTRSKPNERSYHNKLPNLVTGFVKFIYRSNLVQSSSKYWYLGCIWTWGSVPFLAWNTRTRAKRFLPIHLWGEMVGTIPRFFPTLVKRLEPSFAQFGSQPLLCT